MKVHRVRRTKGGTKTYLCTGCNKEILPGEEYFHWTRYKQTTKQRHVKCGFPRPTELSGSKMAQVDEAVQDCGLASCQTVEEIKAALGGVASVANDVAAEYGESADGMEQAFPSGSPTGDACRAVSGELESWASSLEQWEPQEEYHGVEVKGDEFEQYIQQCRDEAEEELGNQPSYEG
jgi:hypothetical protein